MQNHSVKGVPLDLLRAYFRDLPWPIEPEQVSETAFKCSTQPPSTRKDLVSRPVRIRKYGESRFIARHGHFLAFLTYPGRSNANRSLKPLLIIRSSPMADGETYLLNLFAFESVDIVDGKSSIPFSSNYTAETAAGPARSFHALRLCVAVNCDFAQIFKLL